MNDRTGILNPTGNVEIYRVSEETRKKVSEETKHIEDRIRRHNLKSRARSRKEDHERHLMFAESRHNMVERWKHKSKDSPYKLLCYTYELERMDKQEQMEARRAGDRRRRDMIEAMTGKHEDMIVSAQTVKPLSQKQQLALQYRQHMLDESKIYSEKEQLEYLAADQFRRLERTFPHLRSSQSSAGAQPRTQPMPVSMRHIPSSTASTSSSSATHSAMKGKPYPTLPKSRGLRELCSPSSSLEGPLDYTSPSARMKQLEADLSLQFRSATLS